MLGLGVHTVNTQNLCKCSQLHPVGQLTHTRRSDDTPDPDGTLKESVRIKIRHYRNVYLKFVTIGTSIVQIQFLSYTSGRLYDDFIRLFFFHTHHESSVLVNDLLEESDQFRFG